MRYLLRLVAVLSCLSTNALCQDVDMRRVVAARSTMTHTLGGGQAGELLLNTKVQVLEEKGAWSRVQVEGWVRTTTLSEASVARNQAPAPVEAPKAIQGVLKVTEFIRNRRDDISPPREYIIVTATNQSPRTIRAWSGLLVALTKDNTAVFRQRVSEEGIEWKPNSKRDITFSWQPSEEGFDEIQEVTLGEHSVVLLDVQITE